MNQKEALEIQVVATAREQGVSGILLRNTIRRRLKLNAADNECLSLLSIKGTATPTEIARYTGLTTGSATAMLDRLEKAKFIRRKPNPKDRRGLLIEIDKSYGEKIGPLLAGILDANKKLVAAYSAEELKTINDFLTRFTKNVNDQVKVVGGN